MKSQLKEGLVQVYTGSGKGKTTAALGLALRALGHGFQVKIIQFLKGSSYAGEFLAAQRLFPQLSFTQFGRGCPYSALIRQGQRECSGCGECFIKNRKPLPEDYQMAAIAMAEAEQAITGDRWDVVILDEIGNAFRYGLVEPDAVVSLIEKKPPTVELVLTGRGMPRQVIDAADLVTEMQAVKHPWEKGIRSRRGIEY